MYFESLSFSGHPSMGDMVIDFHPRLTVLYGDTGSGKTFIVRSMTFIKSKNHKITVCEDLSNQVPVCKLNYRSYLQEWDERTEKVCGYIPELTFVDGTVVYKDREVKYGQTPSGITFLYDLYHKLTDPSRPRCVFTIDNVETHLHPNQYRGFLTKLMKAFPLVQFIVTTRSPIIFSDVPCEHARYLANGRCEEPYNSYGFSIKSAYSTFSDVGEHPPEIFARFNEINELIETCGDMKRSPLLDQTIDLCNQKFEELQNILGHNATDLCGMAWEVHGLYVDSLGADSYYTFAVPDSQCGVETKYQEKVGEFTPDSDIYV